MKTTLQLYFISVLTISCGTLLAAPPDEVSKSVEIEKAQIVLEKAVGTLEDVLGNPGSGIPQSLIDQSEAFIIFPKACQVAAGPFNGAGGKGIAMIYNEDGSWSNPFFVTLHEGNLGFQIGAQTSDIVLLIEDRNDLNVVDHSVITLGSDVGIAAGPEIQASLSGTEDKFKSEIYSYHLEKGVFTGVNLKGAILGYSGKLDDSYYSIVSPNSDQVNELIFALNMFGD